jgi:hypothetical protein
MLIPADIMCTDPKSSFATDYTAHRIRGPWPGRFLGKLEGPIIFRPSTKTVLVPSTRF